MTTKKRKKTPTKGSAIGDDIVQAMKEAVDFTLGKKTGARVTEFADLEVKRIRKKTGLTQEVFARALGISASGLRKWEQGQRQPHGAAVTLLRIMDKEPEAVVRAIS